MLGRLRIAYLKDVFNHFKQKTAAQGIGDNQIFNRKFSTFPWKDIDKYGKLDTWHIHLAHSLIG